MTHNPDDEKPGDVTAAQSGLDKAAAMGPLSGLEAEDAAEERGEDHSDRADSEKKAEDIGGDDIVGGIAMR
jgi:hypothetical protein